MTWLYAQCIPYIVYTHYEIMAHKSIMTQPNKGSFTRHQSQDFVEWLALWRHAALPPLLAQTRAVRRYALTNPRTISIQRDKLTVRTLKKTFPNINSPQFELPQFILFGDPGPWAPDPMGLELRLLQQLEAVPPANWRQTTTAGDKTFKKKGSKQVERIKEETSKLLLCFGRIYWVHGRLGWVSFGWF